MTAPPGTAPSALCTNAVVASFVLLSVEGVTVGAVGLPVSGGDASGAYGVSAVVTCAAVW